jgi:hypothetical protein
VKRLQKNLITAQGEVVSTGKRLVEMARRRGRTDIKDPQSVRISAEEAEEVVIQPPNPVVYKLLVAPYRGYRSLPAALRRQLNLSLNKLRDQRTEQ